MNEFIPCMGSLSITFLILAFILAMRYLNYKETLKLAEKGLVKPSRANGNGKGALIWGIIITAIGLALIIGLWPLGAMVNMNVPFGFGPWMLTGLIPTFFGLALILIHVLTREDKKEEQAPPGTDAKSE
jgi:hypothetical protein